MIQQPANPCSTASESATVTTATETANPGSENEETAATAAATPCPEICEQTQNTGECPAGDKIFPNTFLSSESKIPKYPQLGGYGHYWPRN